MWVSGGYAVFTNQDNFIRTPTTLSQVCDKDVGAEMSVLSTHLLLLNIVKQMINVRPSTFQNDEFGATRK